MTECLIIYLHDLDVDILVLLSRLGEPRPQSVNSPLQVIKMAIEDSVDILLRAAFLHLENSKHTVHIFPAFPTVDINLNSQLEYLQLQESQKEVLVIHT